MSSFIFLDREKLDRAPHRLTRKEVERLNDRRGADLSPGVDLVYNRKVYSAAWKFIHEIESKSSVNVLDFGCGEGQFGKWLSRQPQKQKINLYGVDIRNVPQRAFLKNYTQFHHINYSQGAPFHPPIKFHACVALFVFHFKVYDTQLRDIYGSMERGGRLIFNTLTYTPPGIHSKILEVGFTLKTSQKVVRGNSEHEVFCYVK